jgi:hypothetical protein
MPQDYPRGKRSSSTSLTLFLSLITSDSLWTTLKSSYFYTILVYLNRNARTSLDVLLVFNKSFIFVHGFTRAFLYKYTYIVRNVSSSSRI